MKNIRRDKICVVLGFCYTKNLSFNNMTMLTEQCLMHKKGQFGVNLKLAVKM